MWRLAAAGVAALLATVVPARADVEDFVGRQIVEVTVQTDGRPTSDSRLIGLIETHVGDVFAIAAVRESITHLFSLGTFEDIRLAAARRGDLVALTYEIHSLKPIETLLFAGAVDGVDEGRLRRLVTERFGASPRANRAADMARLVEDDLKAIGFLAAHVETRVVPDAIGSRSTLRFALTPGVRARLGTIDLVGDAGMPREAVLSRLELATGRVYEREQLTARVDRLLESQRRRGFLAARMTVVMQPVDEGATVNLTINAAQGPRVRVVFAGDAIPSNRQDDLAPIAREGSADEDLLEDSAIRVRELLLSQGYRDAQASYQRQEQGGELVITFTVTRGPQYRVSKLDVTGNNGLTLPQIQGRLRVRTGQPFSVSALNADVAALEDMYRREGFALAEVNPETVLEAPVGNGLVPVDVRLRVAEGPRTVVNAVVIDGARAVPDGPLRAALGLQPGKPYFATQLAIDRDVIQLQYANLGYQAATVTTNATMSTDGTVADVTFTVVEGTRVFVDHVLIVGNQRTKTATIERELQFKPGDPLGLEALNESQRRLSALGLFRRARVTELGHGRDARRDILVTVEEAPATTIGVGGGLEALQILRDDDNTGASADLEFSPRAFFEVGRRNLFGKNRSINLFTRVSLRPREGAASRDFSEYRVIGTFREPRALGTGADAYLTGTLEQERRSSFNFSRRAFNAEVGQKLTRIVSVSGSYQIQRTELFFNDSIEPTDKRLIDRVFPQVRLSSFSLSGVRDTRDDLTDPFAGLFLSLNGQIAGRKIGSEIGLVKTFFSAQKFVPLPHTRRIVLATSARLGMATGFPRLVTATDDTGAPIVGPGGIPVTVTVRDLPASERFFAGGDTTVRGFALDQLGASNTIDKDGFPIGGGGLLILNGELRIPVKGGFGVVGFVDAGNVFDRTSDIDLGSLRSAVGFGVRYKSPIGPIRVDIGFKTRRQDITPGNRESASSVHISLGQAF